MTSGLRKPTSVTAQSKIPKITAAIHAVGASSASGATQAKVNDVENVKMTSPFAMKESKS